MIYYTYFIKWSGSNMKYYGARGSKVAPEDDLWVTYFTSSKYVKQYRKQFGEPDIIQIRQVFDDKDDAFNWERRVLIKTGSKKSDNWLNRYDLNYHGAYGPKNHGDKVSKAMKGRIKSEEHCENLSKAITGSRWVTNGKIHKQVSLRKLEKFMMNNPEFTFGMLPFSDTQRKNQSITRLRLIKEGVIVMPKIPKGTLPWNTGLTKETSETLRKNAEKISKSKTGVPYNGLVWNKGKKYKGKPHSYKNLWFTNGIDNIQIREGNESNAPEGYFRGRTTGWNTASKQVRLDKTKANTLEELK